MKLRQTAASLLVLVLAGYLGVRVISPSPPVSVHAASVQLSAPGEPTDRTPEQYQGSFLDTSLEAMLTQLDVKVYPEDKVFAFPDPALGLGAQIKVYRAQPVVVKDGKTEKLVRTWARNIDAFASEQNLELADKDVIVPPRGSELPVQAQALTVVITRVAEAEISLTVPIPFTTKSVNDPTLEKGTNITDTAGKDGVLQKTFLRHDEDGVEIWRKLIGQKVLQEPVTKVVRIGTKVVLLDKGLATYYELGGRQCSGNAMVAAHKTLPFGTRVRVTNLSNGKSVVVTINDRGPYGAGRVIDLSCPAFQAIASISTGLVSVKVEKE